MDLAEIEIGTKVVLRNGGFGIVVAEQGSPSAGQRPGLHVKLADEGRTILISDPDEIQQVVP